MPKYYVAVTRSYIHTGHIEIEAESSHAAEKKALKSITSCLLSIDTMIEDTDTATTLYETT